MDFHQLPLLVFAIAAAAASCIAEEPAKPAAMERIAVAPDQRGFVTAKTSTPFYPWGLNYGNERGLMEDYWDTDWNTIVSDFREMKKLGANVVRVHLQFGKFMTSPEQPNRAALAQLSRLLRLSEETGLYLDVTALACYRPADVPAWYDALDEPARWAAQAALWQEIAKVCASSPALFCYDVMNEPCVPGEKRKAGQWRSGQLLGGLDFVQFITLDRAGRPREEVAARWTRRMAGAIRMHDPAHLVTVGMLPWSRDWGHLSGFVPKTIALEVDFISVHLYPDSKKPGEALEALEQFAVGKPVVIEETFPLTCTTQELEGFLRASREFACGWIGHYGGDPSEQLDALESAGQLSLGQAVYREWLRLFVRLKTEFVP